MADSVIGATLNGGDYVVIEHLYGEAEQGVYRGRGPGGRSVLITTSVEQADVFAEVFDRLELADVDNAAELLCVNRLEGADGSLIGMVEAEPLGVPVSSLSMCETRVSALAPQLGELLRGAEFFDEVLYGLRPELTYVDAADTALTGVAPRGAQFWAGIKDVSIGIPPCFERVYLAPEILAAKGDIDSRADVFSVCAMLAEWTTGDYPFTTPPMSSVLAPLFGDRLPWTGPKALGAVIDRGLEKSPDDRLDVEGLIAALAAL